MAVALQNVSQDVEHSWRVVDFAEQGGIIRRRGRERLGAEIPDESQFTREVHMRLPRADRFGGIGADALDGQKAILGGTQNANRRAYRLQQTPHADRADFRNHVQGDVGFGIGHCGFITAPVAGKPKENISPSFCLQNDRDLC